MNPARLKLTIAATALGVAVAGCSDADAGPGPQPESSPTESSPTQTPPLGEEPWDMEGITGPLVPGTYSMPLWGQDDGPPLPRVEIEVPEGYFSNGGYVVDAGNGALEPDQWGEVAVWRVEHIVTDPCNADDYAEIGPHVDTLAHALTRQPGQDATRPQTVTLDGYSGVYLEVTSTIPDLGACSYGSHMLWHTGGAGDRAYGQDRPGVTNHLWILDVDGTRLVIAVSNYPDQTDAQHQELIDIAETIHFVEP